MPDPTPTTALDPTPMTAVLPHKPGYATTEFYLSLLAMMIGAATVCGLVPTEGPWPKVAAFVTMVLSSLGYTWSRSQVKTAAMTGGPDGSSSSALAAIATKVAPLFAVVLLGAALTGCGAAAREKAISTSISAAAAVDVMFLAYDQQRLHACVVDNATRDGHDACVTAYLAKRKKVDDSITALRDAVELGKTAKDDGSLAKIAAAALAFEQSINALKEDVK